MKQLKIDFNIIPTKEQVCIMCHLSSECHKCCNKCEGCNARQICMINKSYEDQTERLSSWIHIIETVDHYKKLYKLFNTLTCK